MRVEKMVCDWPDCKSENARSVSTFHDRRADAAGGMENWYLMFDLCADHQSKLLHAALDGLGTVNAKALVAKYKIPTQIG
jgi:hypothetical protein